MLNKDTESMSQSVKHTTKYILNLWVNNMYFLFYALIPEFGKNLHSYEEV